MSQITQKDAKGILRSLGTSGQPPRWGARFINAGTDQFLRRLHLEYLDDHCKLFEGQPGGGACKWVEADYGNGKTQFLRCVQETAWELDYITAYVELSQDESPLDRLDRVYGAVARALQAKPLSIADLDFGKGIDVVLAQLLDRMFSGVITGMPDEALKSQAMEWIHGIKSLPVESTSFSMATYQYLTGLLEGDEEKTRAARLYLRGEPIPTSETKKLGIYEKLDKSTGFRMIRSLTQFVQYSGIASGVVVLFDEARRTLSLMSTKAQKVACENLLSVINRCNSGELPGTLFLYAVMPEFFTNFATNYPALQQRCGRAARINLNRLQGISEPDLLQQIGKKITELFSTAHEDFPNEPERLAKNLAVIATAAIRDTGGTGTRRLLVKSWVQFLNDSRIDGMRDLSESDADLIVAGCGEELHNAEREAVEQEGE